VLDGGQVLISFVEMVIRRELNEKVKEYMFRVGLALILALFIFATWNDLVHLFDRLFVKD
jgi:regulator of sigma E protease